MILKKNLMSGIGKEGRGLLLTPTVSRAESAERERKDGRNGERNRSSSTVVW